MPPRIAPVAVSETRIRIHEERTGVDEHADPGREREHLPEPPRCQHAVAGERGEVARAAWPVGAAPPAAGPRARARAAKRRAAARATPGASSRRPRRRRAACRRAMRPPARRTSPRGRPPGARAVSRPWRPRCPPTGERRPQRRAAPARPQARRRWAPPPRAPTRGPACRRPPSKRLRQPDSSGHRAHAEGRHGRHAPRDGAELARGRRGDVEVPRHLDQDRREHQGPRLAREEAEGKRRRCAAHREQCRVRFPASSGGCASVC